MSHVKNLTGRGIIKPPSYVDGGLIYEAVIGSTAYGVSSDNSDIDVIGICIPDKDIIFPHLRGEILGFGTNMKRFEQFQKHGIVDDNIGYDITVYNIIKYFQLAMDCNPNMIDALFVPRRCITHTTQIGEHLRENRRLFLSKKAWHRFKGYAYAQLHKMRIKNPDEKSKRRWMYDKYGYDCYDKESTEFLTRRGWLKYDDVNIDDELATLDINTNNLVYCKFIDRISKKYTGKMYKLNTYMSKVFITEGHSLLISPCHRNASNNYSLKYFTEKSDWKLSRYIDILNNDKRSWFHIKRASNFRIDEYDVEDEYLKLSGCYISEGTISFENGKLRNVRITQTDKGKKDFFHLMDSLEIFKLNKYDYTKETIWIGGINIARRLEKDFKHLSKNKELPKWCNNLSYRQSKILWDSLILGDGTITSNGEVYYTSSEKLADSIQSMMVNSGFVCSVRKGFDNSGFKSISSFNNKEIIMYQVYLPYDQEKVKPIGLKRIRNTNDVKKKKQGYNISLHEVVDREVVCFEVPTGTLITRCDGNVGIHGNCKFAYHLIRLLNEIEMILVECDLDLERNREQLKSIRRGEFKMEEIENLAADKERVLEVLYAKSSLPDKPRERDIKNLLLGCLEVQYGSLDNVVHIEDKYENMIKKIKEIIERG